MSPPRDHLIHMRTQRPDHIKKHQDFTARIHCTCMATVCLHQPCELQGVILTNSHASMRQSKTRFSYCLRVSGTTSCLHLKDLHDHFCAAIKFQNSKGEVASNSHCKWAFGRGVASCKSDFNLSQFPFSRSLHEQQSVIQIPFQSWFD